MYLIDTSEFQEWTGLFYYIRCFCSLIGGSFRSKVGFEKINSFWDAEGTADFIEFIYGRKGESWFQTQIRSTYMLFASSLLLFSFAISLEILAYLNGNISHCLIRKASAFIDRAARDNRAGLHSLTIEITSKCSICSLHDNFLIRKH